MCFWWSWGELNPRPPRFPVRGITAILAGEAGFEPATARLTAESTTAVLLPKNLRGYLPAVRDPYLPIPPPNCSRSIAVRGWPPAGDIPEGGKPWPCCVCFSLATHCSRSRPSEPRLSAPPRQGFCLVLHSTKHCASDSSDTAPCGASPSAATDRGRLSPGVPRFSAGWPVACQGVTR